ncbi:hypothetical protein LEP1GSC052_2050 [Leptospira kmetyi serovar Malaysia str. Bejo-Iso9]|nr:hypothetical protein LEP1GSC052_2050 [Leptospira kmetyi serovar Malaysia str. Bejo-Iso9]
MCKKLERWKRTFFVFSSELRFYVLFLNWIDSFSGVFIYKIFPRKIQNFRKRVLTFNIQRSVKYEPSLFRSDYKIKTLENFRSWIVRFLRIEFYELHSYKGIKIFSLKIITLKKCHLPNRSILIAFPFSFF